MLHLLVWAVPPYTLRNDHQYKSSRYIGGLHITVVFENLWGWEIPKLALVKTLIVRYLNVLVFYLLNKHTFTLTNAHCFTLYSFILAIGQQFLLFCLFSPLLPCLNVEDILCLSYLVMTLDLNPVETLVLSTCTDGSTDVNQLKWF